MQLQQTQYQQKQDWPTHKRGTIPLPPQMRDMEVGPIGGEAAETTTLELSSGCVTLAELVPTETIAEEAALLVCVRCHTVAEVEGRSFTFCPACGCDRLQPRSAAIVAAHEQSLTTTTTEEAMKTVAQIWLQQLVDFAQMSPRRGSVLKAGLSFCFPGLGQLLNGQVAKGLLLLLAMQFVVGEMGFPPFGLFLFLVRCLLVVDAYNNSERKREGRVLRDWDFRI